MNTVILGGTKGMGRSLARQLAARGDRLFLLGRDAEDLRASAADLETRGGRGGKVGWALCDLADTATFAAALDQAEKELGALEAVIVTAGIFATQDELEADINKAELLLRVDFTNTVIFCEHARKRLLARGGGTLCVFSSVAGDRGRKPAKRAGACTRATSCEGRRRYRLLPSNALISSVVGSTPSRQRTLTAIISRPSGVAPRENERTPHTLQNVWWMWRRLNW